MIWALLPIAALAGALATLAWRTSERRTTEATLRASEERYRQMFEQSGAVKVLANPATGAIVDANEAAADFYGYPRDVLSRMRIADINTMPAEEVAACMQRAAMEKRSSFVCQNRLASGEERTVEVFPSRVQVGGRPLLYSIVQDITDRRRAEDALRASESRYRVLAESVDDIVSLHEMNGASLYFSPSVERATGFAPASLAGADLFDLMHPDDRVPTGREAHLRVARGEPALYQWRMRRADGSYLWLETRATPLAETAGAPARVLCVSRDIDARKQAEAALAESEERFRSLILRAAFGIYRSAPDGRFLDVNPALVRMLGYDSADELMQVRMPQDIFADATECARVLEQEHVGDRPQWANLRWKKKGGSLIDIRLSSRAVRDGGGTVRYYEGIAEDVTDRMRREEALRHSERMASLGHTLAGVAHELNNPLAAISGFAQLLLRQWRDEDDRTALETVHREATRAGKIVKDLLTFSRRQDSRERELLDLNEVVRYIVAAQRYAVETRGIHHEESLAEALPRVLANGSQVEQVVLNLVVNARQALEQVLDVPIEPGAPPARDGADIPLISVRTHVDGDWVILEVEDNGPGIRPEERGRIFDPFWTTKDEGEGTGLGLSVVHGIVTAHGGTIEVHSEVGRGTRFVITLPAAPADLAGLTPDVAAWSGGVTAPPAGIARRPLDMLIVDDEQSILEMLTRYFAERGHAVITASSGAEALSLSAWSSFDVVVCDLRMPEMDGVETITRLRELPGTADSRYVLVTGDTGVSQVRPRVEGLEVAAVLEKPYDMEYLRTAVEGGG